MLLRAGRRCAFTARPVPTNGTGRQLLSSIAVSNAPSIEHVLLTAVRGHVWLTAPLVEGSVDARAIHRQPRWRANARIDAARLRHATLARCTSLAIAVSPEFQASLPLPPCGA